MDPEDDKDLPDPSHKGPRHHGNGAGQLIVRHRDAVRRGVGEGADHQNGEGDHNDGAEKWGPDGLQHIGQAPVQKPLQIGQHQHQEQRGQHRGGIRGLRHGKNQESDGLPAGDPGRQRAPIGVDQGQTAPQRNEGVAFEVLGGRHRDHCGQEGEGGPGDKAQHGVGPGVRKGGNPLRQEDQRPLHQAGGRQDIDEGGKNRGHGGDHPGQNSLLLRGLGRLVQVQEFHQLLIHVFGVDADDDLILSPSLQHLNHRGQFGDASGHLGGGRLPQNQAEPGGAVGCADNILFAHLIPDLGGELGVITDVG